MNRKVMLFVECEIDEVFGDVEHLWAKPIPHRRYMVPKESVPKERGMGANEGESRISEWKVIIRALIARNDERQQKIAGAVK